LAATLKPVLNTRPNKDGLHQVLVRVTSLRKHSYISTGIFIRKTWFNPAATLDKANWIRTACDMHATYNNNIRRLIEKAHSSLDMSAKTNPAELKRVLLKPTIADDQDFIEYFAKELDHIKATEAVATWEGYNILLSQLKKYMNNEPLYFRDFNLKLVKDLEKHFRSFNAPGTVAKKLSRIKTIIIRAMNEKLIKYEDNPFGTFRIKQHKTKKERLNKQEMLDLIAKDLPEPALQLARDIFLFQFLTHGMRIADALSVKYSQISGDYLLYTMGKTGKQKSIKVSPELRAIIERYRSGQGFIFPYMRGHEKLKPELFRKKIESKTALVNEDLKTVATRGGIMKKLTTHVARHTFADLARKGGMNIYNISKALGHANIKETEAYLSSMDQELLDEETGKFYDTLL
jgi:integrase/recombinase XerD